MSFLVLSRRFLLLGLPLMLVTSFLVLPTVFPQAHGALTGTVCMRDPSSSAASSGTPCAGASPTFDGPVPGSGQTSPTQIRIGVYIGGSDGLNGFDITLLANHTVLTPVGVDTTGTVVPGSTAVLVECLSNVTVAGPRCAPTDTVNTLHFALIGGFGSLTTPPTTGLLFIAIYNITGTAASSGISVGFQTGCSDSSDLPFCVNITNGTTHVAETIQAASFNNHTPTPWVALSTNTTSLTFFSGSAVGNHASFTATAKNNWPGVSSDSVSFSSFSSPLGLMATFSPPACSTGGTSCSVISSVNGAAGNYSLTVVGKYVLTDPNFASQTDTLTVAFGFQVVVRDFGFTASPSILTFNAGASPTTSIGLSSLNGFSGTVTLSTACSSFLPVAGAGGGVGGGDRFFEFAPLGSCPPVSLSLTSVSLSKGTSASSTLTVSPLNAAGNYSIFVYADTAPGRHTVVVKLIISDFVMNVSPTSLNLDVSSPSVSSTVSLSSLVKFSGSVTLVAVVSPTGLTVSISPATVSLAALGTATSTLTFSAPTGTPTGSYIVTVNATSGGVSHSANVAVLVHPAGFLNPLIHLMAQHGSSIALGVGLLGLLIPLAVGAIIRRPVPSYPLARRSNAGFRVMRHSDKREWAISCNNFSGTMMVPLSRQSR